MSSKSKAPYFPPQYEYQIANLNKEIATALSILSLTNAQNFSRRREQMIYTALGLGKGAEIRDRTKKTILSNLIHEHLSHGLRPGEGKENAHKLAEGLLKEELTPYEATGIIKELCPEVSAKQMTQLWTKFSIVTGLKYLGDQALKTNLDQSLINDAIKPKIKDLQESLKKETTTEDPTCIKRKYYENYKHLKTSKGANTNWAEVISNLNPEQSGFVKALLESSKDNILKEKATTDCLWPKPIENELKNRRLNNLLSILGNRPTGRSQRYSRIILNERASLDNPGQALPPPLPIVLTEREKEFEKRFLHKLKEIEWDPAQKTPENVKPWYSIFLNLGKLKSINTEDAQLGAKKTLLLLSSFLKGTLNDDLFSDKKGKQKALVFYNHIFSNSKVLMNEVLKVLLPPSKTNLEEPHKENNLQKFGAELISGLPIKRGHIDEGIILKGLEVLCKNTRDFGVLQLIRLLEYPTKYQKEFKDPPFSDSMCLAQIAKRDMAPLHQLALFSKTKDPQATDKRFVDIFRANTKGEPVDLNKTYGKAKLSALHLASWYGGTSGDKIGAELSSLLEVCTKGGINVNPQDIEGNTPLHKSTPYASEELLNSGADPKIKNNQGLPPAKTNMSGESCKRMIMDAAKKETIKKIAASPGLEL
jgi:hypothetical protein